jgi:16S rRNA U1498 N3-methylase RsmE
MNRILFEEDEQTAYLPAADPRAEHIRTVLRAHAGDEISIGIVNGARGTARILDITEGNVRLECRFEEAGTQHSSGAARRQGRLERRELAPIDCIIGHPRPIVLKRLLRDLTTIGVSGILVCGTELGEKSYLRSNLWLKEGVRSYLVAGAAQAGGTQIPLVEKSYSIASGLKRLEELRRAAPPAAVVPGTQTGGPYGSEEGSGEELRMALHGAAEPRAQGQARVEEPGDIASLESVLSARPRPLSRIVYAVGSERGFTESELAVLGESGFRFVSLGERVLRTETAATSMALVCRTALRMR